MNSTVYSQKNEPKSTRLTAPRTLAGQIDLVKNGRAGVIIVYGRESRESGELLRQAIKDKSGTTCDLVPDDKTSINKAGKNLIILGNLATNKLSEDLYRGLYTFEDRYFPGDNGFVVRCLIDPLGNGNHIIVLGGSTGQGVTNAAENFIQAIEVSSGKNVFIKPYLKVQWGKKYKGLQSFPWRMTGGRGPLKWASKYLRSGEKQYAEKYKTALFKAYKKPEHLYCYYRTMLWEVMEACGVFTDKERQKINSRLLEFMRSGQGVGYLTKGYIENHVKPFRKPRIVGNHLTRSSMGFYFGYRYFNKYFRDQISVKELDMWQKVVYKRFGTQLTSYRCLDESYSQHGFGGGLDNALVIALAVPELGKPFFEKNIGRKMADYVFVHCNNMGRTPLNGDTYGIAAPANLFSKLAYAYRDGRYLYMANKAVHGVGTDEPARGFFSGLRPEKPLEHIGAFAITPCEKNLALEPFEGHSKFFSYAQRHFKGNTFDKISFRGGLAQDAPYLLLDGLGGFSHAYPDQNTISEFSQYKCVWISQPDRFRYPGLDSHNALTYTYNGIGPVDTPVIARVEEILNTQNFSFSKTCLPEYGSAVWTRYILFFREKGPFMIIDTLKPSKKGNYKIDLHWHTLGNASLEAGRLMLRQKASGREKLSGCSLSFPENILIQKDLAEDPQRLEIAKKGILLDDDSGFFSLTLSRRKKLSNNQPVSFISLLKAGKDNTPPADEVIQVDETGFLVKGDTQILYAGIPAKGNLITCGEIKITADFALVSPEKVFLVNGKDVEVSGVKIVKFKKKSSGEYPVNKQKDQKTISDTLHRLAGRYEKKKASPEPSIFTNIDTLDITRQVSIEAPECMEVLTENGAVNAFAVGMRSGKVQIFDKDLKKIFDFQADSEVLSLFSFDITGNGRKELLVGAGSGSLYCLDNKFKVLWHTKIPRHNTWAPWYSLDGSQVKALFADTFTGIGDPVIFAGMGDSTVQAISHEGRMLWNRVTEWGVGHMLKSGCFFQKNKNILLTGTGIVSPSSAFYFFSPLGEPVHKFTMPSGYGSGLTALSVHDFNGRGKHEILAGTNRGLIGMYRGASGHSIKTVWEVNLDQCITGIAVLYGKNNQQIITAGSKTGVLSAFSRRGEQIWHQDLRSPILKLAPIGNRGSIAAALRNGMIVLVDHNGKIKKKINAGDNILDMRSFVQGKNNKKLIILGTQKLYEL